MVTTKWGGQTRRPRHSAPRTSAPATADASRNACTRNTKQAGDENGMKGGKGEELELGGRSSTGDNTRPCVRGAGDVSLAPLPAGSAHNQSAATSKRRTTRAGHAALTAPRSARCARAVLGARWGGGAKPTQPSVARHTGSPLHCLPRPRLKGFVVPLSGWRAGHDAATPSTKLTRGSRKHFEYMGNLSRLFDSHPESLSACSHATSQRRPI